MEVIRESMVELQETNECADIEMDFCEDDGGCVNFGFCCKSGFCCFNVGQA